MKKLTTLLLMLSLVLSVFAVSDNTVNAKLIKKNGYWRANGKVTKVKYSNHKFTYYAPLSCGLKGYYEAPSVAYKKGKKTFKVSKECKCTVEIYGNHPKTKKMRIKKFVKNLKKYANRSGGLFMFRMKNKKIVDMTINVY